MEWFVGLIVVLGLGVAGVVLVKKEEKSLTEAERIAENINIIDVTE